MTLDRVLKSHACGIDHKIETNHSLKTKKKIIANTSVRFRGCINGQRTYQIL